MKNGNQETAIFPIGGHSVTYTKQKYKTIHNSWGTEIAYIAK